MSAPWKVQCMTALAKYYEAQAVVEGIELELNKLGLNGNFDVKNRNALQCKCGVWVSFHTWERLTEVTCGDCRPVLEAPQNEVRADAREEPGMSRTLTPVAIAAKPAEEIPF